MKRNDPKDGVRRHLTKAMRIVTDQQAARIAGDLENRLAENLPNADVRTIKRHSHVSLEVTADNLKARELGSLVEIQDQPLSRIIDRLRS